MFFTWKESAIIWCTMDGELFNRNIGLGGMINDKSYHSTF